MPSTALAPPRAGDVDESGRESRSWARPTSTIASRQSWRCIEASIYFVPHILNGDYPEPVLADGGDLVVLGT